MSPTGPSRGWYAVAVVIFALSLVPTFLLGRAVVDAIGVDIARLPEGPERIGEHQLAVYANRADALQRVSCTAEKPGTAVSLEAPDVSFSVSAGGESWHRVAVTPEGMAPGEYRVRCGGSDVSLAADDLGIGPNPQLVRVVVFLVLAFAIPVVAAGCAAAIAVIVALRRCRAVRQSAPSYPSPQTV